MRHLGLDIGLARIGVAVSDPSGTTAFPLKVLARGDDETAAAAIAALIDEQEAGAVIYGYPLSLDGSAGPQAAATDQFVGRLRRATHATLIPQDERLSSAQAERVLIEQGVKHGHCVRAGQ